MFQRTVQGYWLPTPFTSFPFTSSTLRRRVPSGSDALYACFDCPADFQALLSTA